MRDMAMYIVQCTLHVLTQNDTSHDDLFFISFEHFAPVRRLAGKIVSEMTFCVQSWIQLCSETSKTVVLSAVQGMPKKLPLGKFDISGIVVNFFIKFT